MYSREEMQFGIRRFVGRVPERPLTFNSYWLAGDEPALIHTGTIDMWPHLLHAIGRDADSLAYVIVPHFEADECGAIQQVLQEFPQATVIASAIGARQLQGFGLSSAIRVVEDGQQLRLGDQFSLEFLEIPSEIHLGHGIIVFDWVSHTLFSSDFLGQMGIPQPTTVDEEQMAAMRPHNIPCTAPFLAVAQRLVALPIAQILPGHGAVIHQSIEQHIRDYFDLP